MKLLCVIPTYWPAFQFGGTVFAVHYLNRALVKKGIDVTVYTTHAGLGNKIAVNQQIYVDGIKVTYFRFNQFFEFLGSVGWQLSLVLNRALNANLKSFDLVYLVNNWSYPAVAAAYYSRKYGRPYIAVPSGMFYPDTFFKKRWKKFLYYQLVVKRDLECACAIHYTSSDEAQKTHSFLGLKNPTIVIPNGIDLTEFSKIIDKNKLKLHYPHLKDKKTILFLGRINWKKGLDILVKAYAQLLKERKDLHLLVVGNDEGNYNKKVKKWMRICGLMENKDATFTGMLTGEEKLEAYAGSDIFVLPSYSENFGMTVIEAMACGLAVVISNKVGIYREVEENKAGIVIKPEVESLYQGLKSVLDNLALKQEICDNANRLIREYYDIDKIAERLIQEFVKLCSFLA